MKNIPFDQNKIRQSFIFVEATDEVNAIQEYNEVNNNFADIHTYLILANGTMSDVANPCTGLFFICVL